MKLIVDSGSTKTDWIALDERNELIIETQTQGLNPQVLSDQILEERIINNYDLYKPRKEVSQIFFYGAGCGTQPPRELLAKVLTGIFPNAAITVKEDTFAAVYAAADPGSESIVCILGTGSNCSYFDGSSIEQRIISLGYILMDDGSGNYFGRQLLRDYYFNKIPTDLAKIFEASFDLSSETIKTNLYKKPNPNTYLAKFARFLIENKDADYSQGLIKKGLNLFVKNQVLQFENATAIPIHFIGSIAHYLKDELTQVLTENGLSIGKVLRKPIDGLVEYHRSFS
ncbi:MAG: N-acetylglucosamine kinase [Flavobacteriaceae bacterium]